MRVVVLVATIAAATVVALSLQVLLGVARRLPTEPRARQPRRAGSSRAVGPPGGGLDELRQLEAVADRALGGDAMALDRLARRLGTAARRCAVPTAVLPAERGCSPAELLAALDAVERHVEGS